MTNQCPNRLIRHVYACFCHMADAYVVHVQSIVAYEVKHIVDCRMIRFI